MPGVNAYHQQHQHQDYYASENKICEIVSPLHLLFLYFQSVSYSLGLMEVSLCRKSLIRGGNYFRITMRRVFEKVPASNV